MINDVAPNSTIALLTQPLERFAASPSIGYALVAGILVALVIMTFALITVAALVLSGPVANSLGTAFGVGSTPKLVWSIVKWPTLVVAVTAIVALLY